MNSKTNSRPRKGRKKSQNLLKLSKSANNLEEGLKNMQQSSQAEVNETLPASSKYSRANEVTQKLYQDARRRMENTPSKSRSRSKSKPRNPRTNKYLKEMLHSDFQRATMSRSTKGKKLNYFHTSEILKELGFMYSDKDHNDKADERMLFVDFWRCLRGDENDGI